MFARTLCVMTLVIGARADDPKLPELRTPVEFKDITPPPVPDKHGHGEHHTTCGHAEHAPDGGLFATAEYLLLRPRRAVFDYALLDANRDLIPIGSLQTLNYELRSGVRVGLGYQFKGSHWSAGFEYTYLGSGADGNIAAPPGGTLYATLTRPGLNDEAATAIANAGLQYNLYDALVGRHFEIDEHTRLRIYGGFRFATIRQQFNATYDGADANLGFVSTRSDFDGFGPLIGGDAAWSLYHGFHLYAKGHAALMTGTLSNPYSETNNAGLTTYANINYATRRVLPVLGVGIGGGWQHDHVSIRVGYEITNWFNLIDSPRLVGELAEGKILTRSGDLSLEGLFVQFAVAY